MRRCVRQVVVLFAAFLVAEMARGGAPVCPGDCDGDGRVAINELVLAVGIALGRSPLESCPAADSVVDGTVRINELIAAVRSALDGCPAAVTPTATATPTSTPLDVPVIDREPTCDGTPPPVDNDEGDVVARIAERGGAVALRGRHFGEAGGEVWVRPLADTSLVVALLVASWSDGVIWVEVGDQQLAAGQWLVEVRPFATPRRDSVGRFILAVGGDQCQPASLVGMWGLRNIEQPADRFNFFLLADGSVMRPFAGRAAWGKIGTWSVSGNTLVVERCPEPNLESFELNATWTPDAELDEFGVRSCPQSQQGPCPAMRGTFTFYFTNGTSLPSWAVDSAGGHTADQRYDDLFGIDWQDCHGACGEHWSNIFGAPRPCGPL
jgi:hypothetical protein